MDTPMPTLRRWLHPRQQRTSTTDCHRLSFSAIRRSWRHRRTSTAAPGQGMVEYSLILSLIGLLVIVSLKLLAPTISSTFNTVGLMLSHPPSSITVNVTDTCAPASTSIALSVGGTVTFSNGGGICNSVDISVTGGSTNYAATITSPNSGSVTINQSGTYTFVFKLNNSITGSGTVIVI